LVATLVCLLTALPVGADPAIGAKSAADRSEAEQHFRRGRTLYAGGSYAEALSEFEAGFERYPRRGFLVNMGQCLRKLGRLAEAERAYQRFLDQAGGDVKLRAEVEEALVELRAERRSRGSGDPVEARGDGPAATAPTALTAPSPSPARSEPAPRGSAVEPVAATGPPVERAPAEVTAVPSPPPSRHSRSRKWVLWTVVGVLASGAIAGAVVGGVLGSAHPQGGSLGLIDGRR
jgi:hypothetical protein